MSQIASSRSRRHPLHALALAGALAVMIAGCTQSGYCVDVFPNATVTDVLHDEQAGALYVRLQHSLSYCTGTDEKRYSVERITVDLASGAVQVDQRASDTPVPFDLPDTCCHLYRDGSFGNSSCQGCELVLRSRDGRDTAHFTTYGFEQQEVMTLDITRDDVPVAVIDIDGYRARAR